MYLIPLTHLSGKKTYLDVRIIIYMEEIDNPSQESASYTVQKTATRVCTDEYIGGIEVKEYIVDIATTIEETFTKNKEAIVEQLSRGEFYESTANLQRRSKTRNFT